MMAFPSVTTENQASPMMNTLINQVHTQKGGRKKVSSSTVSLIDMLKAN